MNNPLSTPLFACRFLRGSIYIPLVIHVSLRPFHDATLGKQLTRQQKVLMGPYLSIPWSPGNGCPVADVSVCVGLGDSAPSFCDSCSDKRSGSESGKDNGSGSEGAAESGCGDGDGVNRPPGRCVRGEGDCGRDREEGDCGRDRGDRGEAVVGDLDFCRSRWRCS